MRSRTFVCRYDYPVCGYSIRLTVPAEYRLKERSLSRYDFALFERSREIYAIRDAPVGSGLLCHYWLDICIVIMRNTTPHFYGDRRGARDRTHGRTDAQAQVHGAHSARPGERRVHHARKPSTLKPRVLTRPRAHTALY